MPVLPPFDLLHHLVGRSVADTSPAIQPQLQAVVCSWPVSGEYGPGSRILYYVFVTACVLARKTVWLRNACLAAALILPAIAAVHGILLASLHRDGAVDMDIYGAFQICSIGILTAPATVRLSNTYFNNPGRNVLFVWTMLVLAGLLALTVEFFRSQTTLCADDGHGQPLYRGTPFPYGNTTCGLVCSVEDGPYSPMRDGSADNIYVVPAPYVLSFGAATLVSAACCIPGALSMVTTYYKILRTNWSQRFGDPDADEVISGTNGATVGGMKTVNSVIGRLLSVVEIPVFGGAVLALIIVGELNFFSYPVRYQTDPIANISQWSNIVGAVLTACGSLYLLLAKYLQTAEQEESTLPYLTAPCHCHCHDHGHGHPHDSLRADSLSSNLHPDMAEIPRSPLSDRLPPIIPRADTTPTSPPPPPLRVDTFPDDPSARATGLGIHTLDSNASTTPTTTTNKNDVTRALMKIANSFGTASPDRFNDNILRHGKATGFPEIPGEHNRNSKLNQIKQQWGELTDDDDLAAAAAAAAGGAGLTPRGRRSRANSFNSVYRSPSAVRTPSPHPPTRSQTAGPGAGVPGPAPVYLGLPRTHSPESTSESVFPSRRSSAELEHAKSPPGAGEGRGEQQQGRVGGDQQQGRPEPKSQGTVVTLHEGTRVTEEGLGSPAIVLSLEDEEEEEVVVVEEVEVVEMVIGTVMGGAGQTAPAAGETMTTAGKITPEGKNNNTP